MLGRPLSLFDHVAHQLAHQVTQRLQRSGHRNLDIVITQAHWQPLHTSEHPSSASATLVRASVLALMEARYGFAASDDGKAPELSSATEQRIAASTQALVLQALDDVLPLEPTNTDSPTPSHTQHWQWQALLDIGGRGPQPIGITLDAVHSQCLEQRIHDLRQAQQGPRTATAQPPAPLHVQVVARVVEKTICAADLQHLRPGSVLPIALGRATVLFNDSAMLTASVAEHQGKLHLTAFENLE